MIIRIALLFLFPCMLHAEMLSETEVVEHLRSLMQSDGADADADEGFPVARLNALQGKAASVDEWLELLESWVNSSSTTMTDHRSGQMRTMWLNRLMNVLAPSTEWAQLRERMPEIAGEDEDGKNLLATVATVLGGDVDAINKVAAGLKPDPDSWQNPQDELLLFVGTVSDDPELIIQSVRTRLAATAEQRTRGDKARFQVPPLAVKLPREDALELLTEILMNVSVEMLTQDDATRKLAMEAALANINELPAAPWGLTSDGPDAQKLFDALRTKFDEPFTEHDFVQALAGEFHRQIKQGATEEALGTYDHFIKSVPADGKGQLWYSYGMNSDPENQDRYYHFCKLLAEREAVPEDSSFWSFFMGLAMATGQSAEAIGIFEKRVADPELDEKLRRDLQGSLTSAWLADQQLDKALPVLKESLTRQLRRPTDGESPVHLMGTLWDIGRLTGDEKLVEEMQQQVLETAGKSAALFGWSYHGLVKKFVDAGKFEEAQKLVFAAAKAESGQSYGGPSSLGDQLTSLAWIADRAGKAESNMELFEQAPWWGADDLAKLASTTAPDRTPLLVLAARALVASGDETSARPLAQVAVRQHRGNDRAYECLLEIFGDEAIPLLEELVVEDPFEERPLIWHAVLLLKGGDAAGAEAMVRRAIAIDPSDGEQGDGDRMRAYAVLADALEAGGNTEDAALYRRAVAAIRMAETADDFREAGLRGRSIELFKESLELFADAYCIQSRLALDLMAVGRTEEAEVHYQRAYELMPDSFGRVESHCFGCEGVFTGATAEGIAERTFKKLLETSPEKPQLHYLLGYLYTDMNRHKEAAHHLAEATRLDPEYLNAWSKYGGLADTAGLSMDERNRIAQNTVRLAPLGGMPLSGKFTDIGGFSDALHQGLARYKTRIPTDGLLTLPASKALRASFPDDMSTGYREIPAPFGSEEVMIASQSALEPILRLLAEHSWINEE